MRNVFFAAGMTLALLGYTNTQSLADIIYGCVNELGQIRVVTTSSQCKSDEYRISMDEKFPPLDKGDHKDPSAQKAKSKEKEKRLQLKSDSLKPRSEIKTLKVILGIVREEPHFDSKIKYRLERGDTVSVIETEGDWYFVTFEPNRNGWAHKSLFFESEEQQGRLGPSIEIKDIRFEITPRGEERVLFFLGDYLPPHIFSIAGDNPRIVCDFFDASLSKDISHKIKVNGNIIKQIRIGIQDSIKPNLRVVLDLSPHYAYNTWQEFLIDKNIYILVVGPVKNP